MHLRRCCSVAVAGRGGPITVSSAWLVMLFRCSVSLLILRLFVWIIKRGMFKSLTVIVDWFYFSFHSCQSVIATCKLCTHLGLLFLLENDPNIMIECHAYPLETRICCCHITREESDGPVILMNISVKVSPKC